ncbi:energy-coupling factor ABC transporter ATP-binding protein [Planosporangium sp. 12N6]|uniref:energy-coupling factor ABC transporter ATP-binding protein n=1 Tax=Planosporangium spinosum TaxID=3402278 RepID=UPI003CF63840
MAADSRPAGPSALHARPAGSTAAGSRSADLAAADGVVFACRDLRYAYLDRFPALAGVSLDVRRGEKLALLGPNGCGKSTLLKLLAGLIFPDSGTFTAFGQAVTEDTLEDERFSTAFRTRVGFVFQNSDAQVFSPTVREEIAFGCLQLGLSTDETAGRVDDVMAMLDIADLAERAPFQLSGGQKKRVAIASVLVMNPEVLLFDEPTAALDPRTQAWLIDLIGELNGAGKTVVLATHDLDALETIADRCLVFAEDHTISRVGTPDEILADRELLLRANLIHERSRI